MKTGNILLIIGGAILAYFAYKAISSPATTPSAAATPTASSPSSLSAALATGAAAAAYVPVLGADLSNLL